MASQLQVLAIASNLLAGAFPTQPFQLCDIRSNCLSSPGSCTNDAGVAQRTSGSAFCGSATGAPPFSLALLALRAGLGVSALSWAVDSPCTLAGNAPAVDSWTGVVCDLSGQVLSLNMASNLLDARMSEWAQTLNYYWFFGPWPSFLLTMSSLLALNVSFNYLAGPITGTPSASLKSLNVASNLLSGTFPASSTTACDACSNCLADSSKCLASGSSSQRLASECFLCDAGSSILVLGSLKAALGVPIPAWGVKSLCTVIPVVSEDMLYALWPGDTEGVQCSPSGAVTAINLNTRQLTGSMHADISKLTALNIMLLHSNFLAGRLDAFTVPFTSLTKLENLPQQHSYGPTSALPEPIILTLSLDSFPSTCMSTPPILFPACPAANCTTTTSRASPSLPGTAMKHLDLENNYLMGTFPTGSWQSCSACINCFADAAACTADGGNGVVQRDTCSICGSADGTGVLCGGGGASTCQPTAASLASLSTLNSPSAPALPMACSLLPAVPVNSTATTYLSAIRSFQFYPHSIHRLPTSPLTVAALMSIKIVLGVTYTGWAANAVCTLAGTTGTVTSGSLTGVECDSAGNPVKIALNNQQLFGVLPADVTKFTALTYL
ncbi:unnamed protein product [Closterium sp. NIES-65]|nr:unnamed protein product [Closterium sp. NIES-65]